MIGDVLVSTILCNNLRKAYPDAEIHYLVYEWTSPVLEGNANIDKVILFKNAYRKSKWAFYKFMLQIRGEKYHLLIDAYSKLESWLITLMSRAERRISYKKIGRSFLYTDVVQFINKPSTNQGLIIERRLSLLDPLCLDIVLDPIPKLFVSEKEIGFAKQLMTEHHLDRSKKTIMISVFGSSLIKTYPLAYMSKLVDFIVEQADVNILFNYVPNQSSEAKEVYTGCSETTKKSIFFDLLGRNLREYIALMNECDMIIGNDGGATNMAKALNKPSFIIFSPWIEQNMWGTFEDDKFHKSVHLQQYRPDLFEGKSCKKLKKSSIALYQYFEPKYIQSELISFLDFNLKSDSMQ